MEQVSHSVDFKSIGQKFQSGERLDSAEESAVFSLGLEYARSLIEIKKDSLLGYDDQTQDVKDYFAGTILGRIIRLYDDADKNFVSGTKVPEAITRFNELKDIVYKKLSISGTLPDESLSLFFDEAANSYMDKRFDQAEQAMPFIRRVVPLVVANNPPKENDREVFRLD